MNYFLLIVSLLIGSSSAALAQTAGGSGGGGSAASGAASNPPGYAGGTLSTGHAISGTAGSSAPNPGTVIDHAATSDPDASSISQGAPHHDNAVDTPAAERAAKSLGNTNTGILKK